MGCVQAVRAGGVRHLIVHARKCLLNGLNAAQNRSVPPLHYDVVRRLAHDFPEMLFTINGGITITDGYAPYGGGIYNDDGTVTLDGDATITGNTATDVGGGIYNLGTVGGGTSLVTGNTPEDGIGI